MLVELCVVEQCLSVPFVLDHPFRVCSRRLVELNVVEQCLNIFKTGVVQRRRAVTSKASELVHN